MIIAQTYEKRVVEYTVIHTSPLSIKKREKHLDDDQKQSTEKEGRENATERCLTHKKITEKTKKRSQRRNNNRRRARVLVVLVLVSLINANTNPSQFRFRR